MLTHLNATITIRYDVAQGMFVATDDQGRTVATESNPYKLAKRLFAEGALFVDHRYDATQVPGLDY